MTAHAKPVDRSVLELRDPSLLVDQAYVAGEWVAAPDGRTFPVTDPFDGALIVNLPDLGVEAARQAIDTAHAVQKEWAKRTAKERSAVLRRWYDLIIENAATSNGLPRKPSASTATSFPAPARASASSCSSSRWGCARPSPRGTFPMA
ncbi:MAG: succinate-semialdehyde dehydrogenase [Microvirga sp.]|nr:succinate-semialdehyde dehydrogenase [Microvirga sp.]